MELRQTLRPISIVPFTFSCSAILTVLVCYLLSFIPDELNSEYITSTFVHSIENFTAENSEKLQFVFGTITFVIVYYLIGYLVRKKAVLYKSLSEKSWIVFLIAVIWFSVYTFSLNEIFADNLPEVLKRVFIGSFLTIMAFYIIKERIPIKKEIKDFFYSKVSFFNAILLIAGIISIIVVSSFYLRETYFYGEVNVEHHTDAYFYPIWKVWSGQYPLVDFTSLYGYYPYFFVAVMALFGGVSLKKFSVLITLLVAIVFISIFYVLWSICKNKIVAFAGLISIEYVLIMYNTEMSDSFYLQYIPHRMISICVILVICCLYAKHKNGTRKTAKAIETAGWICSLFALLWNIDTGVVVWLGWAIYLCFIYVTQNSVFKKDTWLFFLKTIGKCVLTAILSFSLLILLTYILSGHSVSIKELLFGQNVFYSSGFFMIKMKLYHPWMVLMIIYAIGIAIALSYSKDLNCGREPISFKTTMLFIMGVCGVGAFIYYQGRSHDFVFVVIVWPAIMMITAFLDSLLNKAKPKSLINGIAVKCLSAGLAAILFMFSFGWFNNIFDDKYLIELKNKHPSTVSGVQTEINLLNSSGFSPQNVEMLTAYSAEVYEHFDVRYMPNVQAQVDIFTWEHVEDVQQLIETTRKDVIIGEKTKNYLLANDEEKFSAVLEKRFSVKEDSGFLICKLK